MNSLKLFHIYHSFLLKKWYLFVYLLLIIIALIVTLTTIQHINKNESNFTIGIVDKDQSKETQLILGSVGKGSNLGKNVSLKKYNENEAHQLLKQQKLQGYFVFDKGMTKVFYKNGRLPISVYTYDKQSTKSVVINQLTHSVYDRLMLSMGGILSFSHLADKPSDQDTLMTMTDMLFTGLNRTGSFDYESIHIYDTGSYYVVTGYLFSIFVLCLSLFTVLKMNQESALKERLQMFHFSFEKLTLVSGFISWFYTLLWSAIGFVWIQSALHSAFRTYNWPTVAIQLVYLVTILVLCLIIIDLVSKSWLNLLLKVSLSILIIGFSGITIPTIFFQHILNDVLISQPFSLVTNQMLEITLNNYILDSHPAFYFSLIVLILALLIILAWRYRR
ncbi:ABC transporter permease [Staphylococcus pasteuri]|uniref:ABC transporter permease n=1 Tax=Staphylococcus pasteuri TaxID=45972 RepID=UPI001E585528|nr:ABC transporter permease [Staphylococcus pasteuri]MCE3022120.1 ABC transporter permease [Staphylococcus pasteuri]